jgi:hypothetical protein
MKAITNAFIFVMTTARRYQLRVIPLFALLMWSVLIDATCLCERCREISVPRTWSSGNDFPRGGSNSNVAASRKRMNTRSVQTASSFKDARMRKACGLYVWNAPSALLSIWCNHLARDNVYEGRGGKKVSNAPPKFLY